MKHPYKSLGYLLLAGAGIIPGSLYAGNIPQYKVSSEGTPYTELTGGTAIPCSWGTGTVVLFPGGVETPNAKTAEGFPIGFDFTFGGQKFDQFVVSSVGDVYLGKGNVGYGTTAFRLGMSPIKFGLSKATITYKTTGTAGNRILTIQFKKAIVAETGSRGDYNLQIRLHEADGKVEFAFKEGTTVYATNFGFDTGLRGWDAQDAMQLTSKGINKPMTISESLKSDMLDPDSYVAWDCDDYDKDYSIVIALTPESSTVAPANAPADLTVVQDEGKLNISCKRAEGADATVLLVSETPYTEADLPVDGETFRSSYRDSNKTQIFPTMLGNAKALYYGNAENIEVTLDTTDPSTTYYVKALSVNGYPAYNRENTADVVYTTLQAAPTLLRAETVSDSKVSVTVEAEEGNQVIVATTTTVNPAYQPGYNGVFGIPSADVKVGDEIPGGGKVVYVGDPQSFTLDCEANTLKYLRAWTIKDGRVSATNINTDALPAPSYPYEPAIETWPYGEQLKYWHASDNQFVPYVRAYAGDRAICAVGTNDEEVRLTTPALPLDSSVKLTFEFAMETARDAAEAEDGGVAIPQGSDPGSFGDTGYLRVYGGETLYKTVNKYSGTMVTLGGGTNEDGSSTYETVEVDMPVIGYGETITFTYSVPKFSKLYIRNIKIERTGEAPKAPEAAPTLTSVEEQRDGHIYLTCNKGEDAVATLVLFSETPFTEAELPSDGHAPAIGSKIGAATVLYYGTDEVIETSTGISMPGMTPIVPDYDTDYYFCALSANQNPLFNTTTIAKQTVHTMPDLGYPSGLKASPSDDSFLFEATRPSGADGTIFILTQEAALDTKPTDGTVYKAGDTFGNGKVIYVGEDAKISLDVTGLTPATKYTVTGWSYNTKGWYSDISRSVSVETLKAPETAPVLTSVEEQRDGRILLSIAKGEDAHATLVLVSSTPFSEAELPLKGQTYEVGSKLGEATVLYNGTDATVETAVSDLTPDADYHFRAISASDKPLYNTADMAEETLHTMPQLVAPGELTALTTDFSLTVEADRAAGAEGTLLVLSETATPEATPEDGKQYTAGEAFGNGKVIYSDTDSHIKVDVSDLTPATKYVVTGWSYNAKGWYSDSSATVTAETTGIDSISADQDLRDAAVYTPAGVRLHVEKAADLLPGIYVINGQKVLVR